MSGIDRIDLTGEGFSARLYEEITDALILTTVKGNVLLWSRGAEALHGYSADEALGSRICDLTVPPQLVAEHARLVERALAGELITYEALRRRKNGSLVYVNAGIKRFDRTAEDEPLLLFTKKDVTRLKATRDGKLIDVRYHDLLESMPDAIVVLNDTGHIAYINRQTETLFGYTESELIGEPVEVLMPERFRDRHIAHRANYFEMPRGRSMGAGLELFGMRKNGSEVAVEISLSPLRTDGMSFVLSAVRDLTEKRQIERSLQLAQAQKMETVGQLTGGIAHDFNNLLTVIAANGEDLRDELDRSPSLQGQADMILRAAHRGADLVRQLLAFARKQDLHPKTVDINALVETCIALLRRTLPEDISVREALTTGLPAVYADAGSLENAILNLALNARDAMPRGGSLTFETSLATLDADYAKENPDAPPGTYVMLVVADTGSGMPKEVIQRAFEPFFTTKEVGKGSGLGLSMVYGFVKQSGGHAKIYSEIGHGTTVRLYLPPRDRQTVLPERPVDAPAAEAAARATILLVEDDDLVRTSVTAKLQRMGHTVTAAENAQAALAVLEGGFAADLVLTDVIMPGNMTGADLAREIMKRWPHIGVLATSGYTETTLLGKVAIPEGVRLLSKPYSNAALAAAIREALSKRRAGTGRDTA